MVKGVLQFVYREVQGLHQAAYVLAFFAIGSQLLALLRDRLLAHQFGAGAELDIYYTAFRIPDLLYVLFASTLSVYVLIPFIARFKEQADPVRAQHLLSQIATLFLCFYSVLALGVAIFAPYIANTLFSGIADQELLVMVMRILLLQPLLLGLSSLFGVVTQLGHRFVLYAVSPLIYNVGIIVGIVFAYPAWGLNGIALGVVLGALGHMLIQWPLVRSSDLSFSFTRTIVWSDIRAVLTTSIPRALTLSCNQVVLLVLISLAAAMSVGSVSVFQFAYNLQSVPLAVVGVSYSVAAFPMLAKLYAADERVAFADHIMTALRHIIFWAVPITALVIVLRAQIVRVVLGSGSFDWSDTRLTAAVLGIFIVALVAQALSLVLVRAFYAAGNTRLPLMVAVFGGAAAISSATLVAGWYQTDAALQSAVSSFLRVDGVAGTEVLALAAGYAGVLLLQSGALLYLAARQFSLRIDIIGNHLLQATAAAFVGGTSAYVALQFFVSGLNTDTFIGIFLQGALAGVVGVVGVVLAYAVLRTPELDEVFEAFQKRIFKTDVVAPQKDLL